MNAIPEGSLLAWIEQRGGEFIGAFVGEGATRQEHGAYRGRDPAIRFCRSADEARRWIESEAALLRLPVKWLDGALPA
jgi:hypothetical protein